MKTALFLTLISCLISCNPKSTEKIKAEETTKIETEQLVVDSATLDTKKDTLIAEIATEEIDGEDVIETILEFKKTACFGNCPSFSVQLLSDGRIFYDGKSNVEKIGLFESSVNNSFIYTVFQEAEKIGFFDFNEKYPKDGVEIPDMPKTIIFLKIGKKEHRIIDAFNSPLSLQKFEKYLNQKIDELYWTKVGPRD